MAVLSLCHSERRTIGSKSKNLGLRITFFSKFCQLSSADYSPRQSLIFLSSFSASSL